ncbi:YebC/PmpR family DNA-binding transcriptional regulator [Candidatus Shapirobacteria bacterium]|nr:YebC/PmpR family DNA-binding transcriptional regulator [Candidatus Shapirobacteria bacterium]
MSGHSKWANIKNRKGAQDKKRSESFTRVSKDILTAIRGGGGNTNQLSNTALSQAIIKAREVNMPKENIERLISRFEERKSNLITAVFEGFGPLSVPIVVEVETDNKNRTLGEIKLIFRDHGASLGEAGSVAFLFDRLGEIVTNGFTEDQELELIDDGAKDFQDNSIFTEVSDLHKVAEKVKNMGVAVESSGIIMKPKSAIELSSEDDVSKILDLIEELEENDDVVNVFAGFDYHE